MSKIGLALSGGGFRASLYHLGLVRFLRDAGILPQVTHITSVSGGSIFAAHLVLHWDRYNGSASDFDTVASEFLSFVRLDVRNRITRRFPLAIPLRWPLRLLGFPTRKMTRTGLLEYHYERHLYGDISLFELPEKPQLHILATNLSEGCLCSFNRNGLLMMRRQAGSAFRTDRIHLGLATVPMAVAASSAFPGFFPPVELTGADVGASGGEFGRQAYTDGGVFDNLGVRMFGCLARSLLIDDALTREDFVDFRRVVAALQEAGNSGEDSPLHRLAQLLAGSYEPPGPSLLANGGPLLLARAGASRVVSRAVPEAGQNAGEEWLLTGLADLLRHHPFHREPHFARLKPENLEADSLLQASHFGGRVLDAGDLAWLNRHLLEAAFRQAAGQPCFRRLNNGLDGVLVSDVGKPIEVQGNRSAGGLIRTALRATDILMDRVWQLENDTFQGTPGFVFAPITSVIEPAEDPTALHPEIQRQAANIRTDLDRFSPLEISSLVRHGYCVGRKACRSRPDLFGEDLPAGAPWDPVPESHGAAPAVKLATRLDGASRQPGPTTVEARTLQASSSRRIVSTLLSFRDWTSYVYVPILVPLLFLAPYLVVKFYRTSYRNSRLVDSLSQGSRDLEVMSALLAGPKKPFTGETAEEVRSLGGSSHEGFEILQDSRIIDMRPWNPAGAGKGDAESLVYGYRRMKILKLAENTDNQIFRIGLLATSPKTQVRFPPQQLRPKLRVARVEGEASAEKKCLFDVTVDFSKVPAGDFVDLIYEHFSPGVFLQRGEDSSTITFLGEADTAESIRWFLMPEGKEYRNFRILRYETDKPEKVEPVKVVNEYMAEDSSILSYKLMSVKAGYTYEVTWFYK